MLAFRTVAKSLERFLESFSKKHQPKDSQRWTRAPGKLTYLLYNSNKSIDLI